MTTGYPPIMPHSALRPLASNLWLVTGSLKGRHMPRNMVVHRLSDGTLLLHSVIALDDKGFAALEALGRPATMIVPNAFHRMDARRYRDRYPEIQVLCPAAARSAVAKVVPVDATCEDGLSARGVVCHAASGLGSAELVYELETPDGFVLVATDLFMNLPDLPGMDGLMLRLFGPGKGFGVTRIAKLLLVKNRAKFRDWLIATAARKNFAGILVAHGEPIMKDAPVALRSAAARL